MKTLLTLFFLVFVGTAFSQLPIADANKLIKEHWEQYRPVDLPENVTLTTDGHIYRPGGSVIPLAYTNPEGVYSSPKTYDVSIIDYSNFSMPYPALYRASVQNRGGMNPSLTISYMSVGHNPYATWKPLKLK